MQIVLKNFFTRLTPLFESSDQNMSAAESAARAPEPSIMEFFRQLKAKPISSSLNKALSRFNIPRPLTQETFAQGVLEFIKLTHANRAELYGSSYLGLHYSNDLARIWNEEHPEQKITPSRIVNCAPSPWDYVIQDGAFTLVYKGTNPAQALDNLLKGPTNIDCGMFTQLSLWFGIRYLLGNERFNQCFGRAPFFITQAVYSAIPSSDSPYAGTPLFSFLSVEEANGVSVVHIANVPDYLLKHPGGSAQGENAIVLNDRHYIFRPSRPSVARGLSHQDVSNLLLHDFNLPPQVFDDARLSLYAENPETVSPRFHLTFAELIEQAARLRDTTLTEAEFKAQRRDPELKISFDLNRFAQWLEQMENPAEIVITGYQPRPIETSELPEALLQVIPFENRARMSFAQFRQETAQQIELINLSLQFCQQVSNNQSQLTILTGAAGLGKTAAAVCAAKELIAKGRRVEWISEITVKRWANLAKSIVGLSVCGQQIDALLARNPDAVFLDDNNLAGFSGTILLEKLYLWYVNNSGKGLFITSNEPINFETCYGYKLNRSYNFPPFTPYDSSQYLNQHAKTNVAGVSLRERQEGKAIAAIVSEEAFNAAQLDLSQIEWVPAVLDNVLAPLRCALRDAKPMTDLYKRLRPIDRAWIDTSRFTIRIFEKTRQNVIAVEIKDWYSSLDKKYKVDSYCMRQLIAVLNYAHDTGGKQILFINQTHFNCNELLEQMRQSLPEEERERSWDRLKSLLCETEETIFPLLSYGLDPEEASEALNGPQRAVSMHSMLETAHHANRFRMFQTADRQEEIDSLFASLFSSLENPAVHDQRHQ